MDPRIGKKEYKDPPIKFDTKNNLPMKRAKEIKGDLSPANFKALLIELDAAYAAAAARKAKREETLKKCADICRKYLKTPLTKKR